MPPEYKWFKPEEVDGLDYELVAKLDQARELAKTPFRITSGLRTSQQNEQLANAVQDSSHLGGFAVDLACSESQERFFILKALLEVGFCRIGIYEKHIHVDNSSTLPQDVMWYTLGA